MKTRIGITSTFAKLSEFSQGVYVHHDYAKSVSLCGGLPLVLPVTDSESICELVDLCDGLIFTGGEDVDPKQYGEDPHPQLGSLYPERDECELVAIRYAMSRGIPILAICRGVQLLNVALGGTLYQDLPSQYQDPIQHSQKSARGLDTHFVTVEEDSLLFEILGSKKVRVNSLHHQALKELGEGLVVTARASDGVIEAVECRELPFVVGVQWHPESMAHRDPLMRALFQALIGACPPSGTV